MKKFSAALLFSLLAVLLMGAAASTSLVYVDTTSRALTGNIVAGNNTTISASGNGTITATAAPLSGLTGLGTGVGTFLATPSSANLASAVTNETGSGALVFATSPTLVTPVLGAATGTSLSLTGAATSNNAFLVDTNTSFVTHTATAAKLQSQTSWGGVLSGFGTTNDVSLFNKSGGLALSVPTGTTNVGIAGNATVGGTLTVTGAINSTSGITSSDLILGTSGPSVKSTLSARAPRQGLVFDGTAGTTVANVAAFGSGNFTVYGWINQTTAANAQIVGGLSNCFVLYLRDTGKLTILKQDVGGASDSTGAIVAGKNTFFAYTKSGGTGTFYFNGIAGGTITDSYDYTTAFTTIGKNGSGAEILTGSLSVGALNRALSAAEVVALYEAGAPSAADYNTASNTAINTSSFVNFASYQYTTFTSASATGFSATYTGSTLAAAQSQPFFSVSKGQQFLVTFSLTLNSGQLPTVVLENSSLGDASASVTATAGSNSFVLTSTVYNPSVALSFLNSAATDFVVSNVSVKRLGLLLAPDAQQVGGGSVWADTSGNAAHITLPASGVAWNVPSQIGEYVENSVAYASRVSLTNNVAGNVVSLALTAGDWDVSGTLAFSLNSATVTGMSGGISSTSATLGGLGTYSQNPGLTTTASAQFYQPTPTVRVSLTSATTVYLVGYSLFSAGTVDGFGHIRARRVR